MKMTFKELEMLDNLLYKFLCEHAPKFFATLKSNTATAGHDPAVFLRSFICPCCAALYRRFKVWVMP